MPYKKLLTIVTVMLMVGSKVSAQQSVLISDLRTIESLIASKESWKLYQFLIANPRTTAGNDSLARELQDFVRDVEQGSLEGFSAPTATTRTANSNAIVPRNY